MIKSDFEWNGDKAFNLVIEAGWEGIQRATVYFWQHVQQALNKPNVRVKKKGGGVVWTDSSKPGEPPRKRTGFLQGHVKYELDKKALASRVGLAANAKYGLFLEMGTKKMDARPWLLATLEKVMPQLRALVGTVSKV